MTTTWKINSFDEKTEIDAKNTGLIVVGTICKSENEIYLLPVF